MSGFFDVPNGYRDADFEMADLEEMGRRACQRYRVFGYPADSSRLDILKAHGTVETLPLVSKETGETFTVLARWCDEDEIGPICEYSGNGGRTWHETRRAANADR